MKLSETENVGPLDLKVSAGVSAPELHINAYNDDLGAVIGIALDQTTAAELRPILQHFIETGELPK
jgi:hypothetical protein